MTDHRKIQAGILGYFLIISSVIIFICQYIDVSRKLEEWNQSNQVWNVLRDFVPIHIISVFLGLFTFSLRKGLEAGHSKAMFLWTVLCLFLLGDSAYTLTVKFHIFILLKAVFFAYLAAYAIVKTYSRKVQNDPI